MAGPRVTTGGLQSRTAAAAAITNVQYAVGAGSADVLTAAFDTPVTELTDGLTLHVRVAATNTVTTPTFQADSMDPKTITKDFGEALEPGDVPQDGLYSFNAADDVWVLLNPNSAARNSISGWAVAGGTADAITATYDPPVGALVDGMRLRFRALIANATTAPTFSPSGFTPRIIKKFGAQALDAGDIPRINSEHDVTYHYDATTPWWELLNPATGA